MTTTTLEIRPPAVGGLFYPGSAAELAAEVRTLLAGVPARAAAPGLLKALIVPHAGFRYSGPIAASAYALLRRRRDSDPARRAARPRAPRSDSRPRAAGRAGVRDAARHAARSIARR